MVFTGGICSRGSATPMKNVAAKNRRSYGDIPLVVKTPDKPALVADAKGKIDAVEGPEDKSEERLEGEGQDLMTKVRSCVTKLATKLKAWSTPF